MSHRKSINSSWCILIGLVGVLLSGGCGGSQTVTNMITVAQLESLRDIEAMLPLAPDSVIARYLYYDSTAFLEMYSERLSFVVKLIDSLNKGFPDSLRIDTLAIDRSLGSFGEAARRGKSIFFSSSYFIVFDDDNVLRSVIFHEFGHLTYKLLDFRTSLVVDSIWSELSRRALLYLFHEGEYSGNARFGGHPEESSEEMYASVFNILNNCPLEFRSRLRYVDEINMPIIHRIVEQIGLTKNIFE